MPDAAVGKRHPVGKHRRAIESPVAVGVFEPADAVGELVLQLLFIQIHARGVADVQPSVVVEAGHQRVLDQWRPSDQLGREPRRQLQSRQVSLARRQTPRKHDRPGEKRQKRSQCASYLGHDAAHQSVGLLRCWLSIGLIAAPLRCYSPPRSSATSYGLDETF